MLSFPVRAQSIIAIAIRVFALSLCGQLSTSASLVTPTSSASQSAILDPSHFAVVNRSASATVDSKALVTYPQNGDQAMCETSENTGKREGKSVIFFEVARQRRECDRGQA